MPLCVSAGFGMKLAKTAYQMIRDARAPRKRQNTGKRQNNRKRPKKPDRADPRSDIYERRAIYILRDDHITLRTGGKPPFCHY
jgi:hypothetical protein